MILVRSDSFHRGIKKYRLHPIFPFYRITEIKVNWYKYREMRVPINIYITFGNIVIFIIYLKHLHLRLRRPYSPNGMMMLICSSRPKNFKS